MTHPTVCAILLTADRPDMARRAVECFRAQTYPRARLLIYDTGAEGVEMHLLGDEDDSRHQEIAVVESAGIDHDGNRKPIGYLRNRANAAAAERDADILIHFDDDDCSHPNRIAEQVALLQSSGADVVGYNQTLFWRQDPNGMDALSEAWLYSNPNPGYALGTSLCYWRKTWERKPFAARNTGEDLEFCTGLNVRGLSSLTEMGSIAGCDPRMIARIHASNTSTAYTSARMAAAPEWRRVPEWDKYCRRTLEA